MAERVELLEAALEVYPEGVALLDATERVVLWNRAAERLTGYAGGNLIGRSLPGWMGAMADSPWWEPYGIPERGAGLVVHVRHQNGHDLTLAARRVLLRDSLGVRIGTACIFHPADCASPLPHGAMRDGAEVRQSLAETEERLGRRYEALLRNGIPLGLLWIAVDQEEGLRKTHGEPACEAMVEAMERALANCLWDGYEIGRWGDGEFLVLGREGDAGLLRNRGHVLTGVARTADFSWWGDRVTLSVSVGAARAVSGEPLRDLLARARNAMQTSMRDGGNRVTLAEDADTMQAAGAAAENGQSCLQAAERHT